MFAIRVVETLEDHKPRDKKDHGRNHGRRDKRALWLAKRNRNALSCSLTSEVANHQTVP